VKLLDYNTFSSNFSIPRWEEADMLIPEFSEFKVTDYKTGKSWRMMITSGKYHADVEPVTKSDTQIMNSVFAKDKSFESAQYRPVIIEKDGLRYGAALMGFPHAGSLETKFKETTPERSGGFGEGPNWDYIRDNDAVGHFCLHFKGSIRHTDEKVDDKAQEAINKLSNLAK